MQILIGQRRIAQNEPCYIVAEIGINHNGDFDLARKSIDAAKKAGVDAVKFQNFATQDFVKSKDLTMTYNDFGGTKTETLYDLFKRVEMSDEMLADLVDYCNASQIDWHSTPTNDQGIDNLIRLGAKVLKNGSDYLGHIPLLKSMGKTGVPIVISTGMASLSDIEDALEAIKSTGNDQILILHCTSQYPTPAIEANVRRVETMASTFGCIVGFSDHTQGSAASVAAVTLGARWVEKHFTLDKKLPGPDHAMSCDPDELTGLVNDLRFAQQALGNANMTMSDLEKQARLEHRLSCTAARAMKAGEVVRENDITFSRPGTGLAPKYASFFENRCLAVDVSEGQILTIKDLS